METALPGQACGIPLGLHIQCTVDMCTSGSANHKSKCIHKNEHTMRKDSSSTEKQAFEFEPPQQPQHSSAVTKECERWSASEVILVFY